jgi:two-component system chemotaxis sensor kinase CheA
MNLAGELVLSRNQLGSAIASGDPRALAVANQRVSYVTSELQEAIMRTRLQPIGNVFSKFPRVVRDLAKSLGKEVILDIKGESVALDRSLAEGLSDPLTHMVRNAVDHGIELPADRISNGKRPAGTLRIEARHEAGQMLIEIADDGGGIKPDRVAESAIKKGLISAEKVMGMTEAEKIHLIFLPGLSTAAQVTHVSGRGVGMDVVKTNLDRLGGKVAIKSVVGQGSIFTIKLPLTLAIIPALIVSNRSEYFAIPQVNIVELIRVEAREIATRTSLVGKAPVLMLRDLVIPLVYLSSALEMVEVAPATPNSQTSLEIVVVSNAIG